MKHLPLFFAILLLPVPALAGVDDSPGLFASWVKLLAGLALVLGLLYLFYAMSRKGLSLLPGAKTGVIKIVEVRSLGPKRGVCLIEVRGQELLLGFGPERVDFLANIGAARVEENFASRLEAAQGEPK